MRGGGADTFNLIDRLSPEVVAGWLPAAVVEAGREIVERGRVARPAIRETSIQALVADGRRGRVRVRLGWDGDGPVARCECGRRAQPCAHAAAVALLLIGEATRDDDDEREDAPRSLAEEELARRRERGASELFAVTPHPTARVYGRYDVAS